METYTPISVRSTEVDRPGTSLRIAAVIALGCFLGWYAFARHVPPDFHNYGVVKTSIGVAAVACGGEASDGCGVDTAVVFRCTAAFRGEFGAGGASADNDRRVREMIGKRPPSGKLWFPTCRDYDDMIAGQPPAQLDPA